MNKRYIDIYKKIIYNNEKTPLSVGTLAVMALCVLTMIVASFTQIDFVHPWFVKGTEGGILFVMKSYPYVPQIPVALFIITILGKQYGFLTMLIYILMGLFVWPVFGMGGGIGYLKTGFFGYIFGYLLIAIFSGNYLTKEKTFKNILIATFLGVIAFDISGLVWSFVLAVFKQIDFAFVGHAIRNFSLSRFSYDVVLSIVAIYLGILAKYPLWLTMYTNVQPKKRKNNYKKAKQKVLEKRQKEEFDINLDNIPKKSKKKSKKKNPKKSNN